MKPVDPRTLVEHFDRASTWLMIGTNVCLAAQVVVAPAIFYCQSNYHMNFPVLLPVAPAFAAAACLAGSFGALLACDSLERSLNTSSLPEVRPQPK